MRFSRIRALIGAALMQFCFGCHHGEETRPPPDARRPELRSEAELAADRQSRINNGEIVQNAAPMTDVEKRRLELHRPKPAPQGPRPKPGDIQSDILLVNDVAIKLDELLFSIHQRLIELKTSKTSSEFRADAAKLLRQRTSQEVGAVLVYYEAIGKLNDPQQKALDDSVDRELERRVNLDHGGSTARLTQFLQQFGITYERYRELVKRDLVVASYTRERFMPQIFVRRAELLEYYKNNVDKFSTPETRELWLIEIPFASCLPAGAVWETATQPQRAAAKLQAMRQARQAREELAKRPFDEVAREYSKGPHGSQGGLFGEIGAPLKKPYEAASKLIFQYSSGQYSEPQEIETGWVIVRLGAVKPAVTPTFEQAQEDIRKTMIEERYNKLANEYVVKLAERSTITAVDSFIATGVMRAEKASWMVKANTQ